ncbi:putative reverse transcriptase domain-containing protein [Tanacetum coccineum]|uniref:Reverse transcriptase domain-containing protein n=1 Tax=Tanacetum coccineum TaxID=301880 RepID=A0ABQ5HV59_9ASTR
MYDSWASRIRLFIKGKNHGRTMLDSIENGILVYPTVKEDGKTRPNKYFEFTKAQQLQDDCDVQTTNIIIHGLPPDVLYNLFDKFAYVQGETLYKYYWIFSQLINDMHTIGMTIQQVQVNTKFLNTLPPKWSKFVTDVKLAKSLYTTNYDQLYAYLSQHEQYANEVRFSLYTPPQQFTPAYATPIHHQHHHTLVNPQQQLVSPKPFISPSVTQQSQAEFPQLDSSLVVPTFNKERIQLTASTKKWHSYLLRHQASQVKVVKCNNCLGEGHMAKQCTQPKRLRNFVWFKEKLMLVKAQEDGQILNEEQLAFIADPGIAKV